MSFVGFDWYRVLTRVVLAGKQGVSEDENSEPPENLPTKVLGKMISIDSSSEVYQNPFLTASCVSWIWFAA